MKHTKPQQGLCYKERHSRLESFGKERRDALSTSGKIHVLKTMERTRSRLLSACQCTNGNRKRTVKVGETSPHSRFSAPLYLNVNAATKPTQSPVCDNQKAYPTQSLAIRRVSRVFCADSHVNSHPKPNRRSHASLAVYRASRVSLSPTHTPTAIQRERKAKTKETQ
jgi:hypothetical protein